MIEEKNVQFSESNELDTVIQLSDRIFQPFYTLGVDLYNLDITTSDMFLLGFIGMMLILIARCMQSILRSRASDEARGPSCDALASVQPSAVMIVLCVLGMILFTGLSRALTKTIFAVETPSDTSFMGYQVPAGSRFYYPVFLACFQFGSSAIVTAVSISSRRGLSYWGGDFWETCDRRWALLIFCRVSSQISTTLAVVSLPLSVFAVSRALGSPITQGFRIALLGVKCTRELVLEAGLITFAVSVCLWASLSAGDNDITASGNWDTGGCLVVANVCFGVILNSAYSVYQEQVMREGLQPLQALLLENCLCFCVTFILVFVFTASGIEDVRSCFGSMLASPQLFTLLFGLGMLKFINNLCKAYVTFLLDSFWKVSLRVGQIWFHWILELTAFYILGQVAFANAWQNPSSWLMLLSLLIVSSVLVLKQFTKHASNKADTEKPEPESKS